MIVSEHEFEPVHGLPEQLPPGERVLWQGAPDWWALTRSAFRFWHIAAYFGVLLAWVLFSKLWDGVALTDAAVSAVPLIGISGVCLALLALLGWMSARTTIYTVTNKRIVLRIGIALTMAINVPHREIASAGLRQNRDGSGDITLKLTPGVRIAYLHLWPHARAWCFTRPEPMLRAIPDVQSVGALLADTLDAQTAKSGVRKHRDEPRPVSDRARMPVAAE